MSKVVVHNLQYKKYTFGYRFDVLNDSGSRVVAFDVSKVNGKSFMSLLKDKVVEKGSSIECTLINNTLVSYDESKVVEVRSKDSAVSAIGLITQSEADIEDTSWYPEGYVSFDYIPEKIRKMLHFEGILMLETLLKAKNGVNMCVNYKDRALSELHTGFHFLFRSYKDLVQFYYNVASLLKLSSMKFTSGEAKGYEYIMNCILSYDSIINDITKKGLFQSEGSPWWNSDLWGTSIYDENYLLSSLGYVYCPASVWYDYYKDWYEKYKDDNIWINSLEKWQREVIMLLIEFPSSDILENEGSNYCPSFAEKTFNTGLYNRHRDYWGNIS